MLDASGMAHHIVTVNTVVGSFQIELYDNATPATVANFLKYVTDGDYNNTFFHRLVPGFVLQGGGYTFDGTADHIAADPPVVNEFDPSRSNLRGTIAMAKLGSGPDTATTEWFVNLGNNSANLDNQNGGFTVFGQVLGNGMQIVDAIAALPRVDADGAFDNLPVLKANPTIPADLVIVNSISTITGSVSGSMYGDQNNNGQRDGAESGLSNVTVFVDNNNNGALDAGEQSTTSDTSGNYTLSNVPFGTFTVRALMPSGSFASAPTSATRSITFTSTGQVVSGQDFGIVQVLVPSLPDLSADRDTGVSSTDNVTKQTALQFVVANVVPGATVNLFDGSSTTPISSMVATSASVTFNVTLAEGVHAIRAEQTLHGIVSGKTAATTVTVDTTARVIDAIPNQAVNVGEVLSPLNVQSTEEGLPDSIYNLVGSPTGMTIDANGAISYTPTDSQVGHKLVTVEAVDLAGNVAVRTFDVAVNGRPLLPPIPNKTVNRGATLTFTIEANDIDALEFEPLPVDGQPYPTGATLTKLTDTTAQFQWTLDAGQTAETVHVTVRVRDPGGLEAFQTFQISVNAPPVIDAISDKTVNELSELSFSVVSHDIDAVTFSLLPVNGQQFPTGATISASGQFQWTPTEAQDAGEYQVTVQATDTGGLTATRTFKITVSEVNQTPVLAAIADKLLNRGDSHSFTATATDADLPVNTLLFSLGAGAPDGAAINPTSGLFTWTPAASQAAGPYSITVRVSDGTATHERTFQVTLNDAPVLDEIANKAVDELSPLTFTVGATDLDTVTYSLVPVAGQAFPTGATINPTTGQFQWTPTEAQGEGVYQVTIKASDTRGLSTSRTIEIAVAEVNEPPVVPTIENKSVNQGDAVHFVVGASDPDAPTQTLFYSLGPDAPAGASIDPVTGQFTWLVSDSQSAGTFNVTILVSDDGGQTFAASQMFEIEVNANTVGFALFQTTPFNGAASSAGLFGAPALARDAAFSASASGPLFGGFTTFNGFQSFSDVNSTTGRLPSGVNNSILGADTGVPHALEELMAEMGTDVGDVQQTGGKDDGTGKVEPAVNFEPPGDNSNQGDKPKGDAPNGAAAQNGQSGGVPGVRVSHRNDAKGAGTTNSGGSAGQSATGEQPSPDASSRNDRREIWLPQLGFVKSGEPRAPIATQGSQPQDTDRAATARTTASRRPTNRVNATSEQTDNDTASRGEKIAKAALFLPLVASQLPKGSQKKPAAKRKQRV